jgi:predicted SprT family Zn-dependent metalloprotease
LFLKTLGAKNLLAIKKTKRPYMYLSWKDCHLALYKAYDTISYQYSLKLPKPLIEIVETGNFWGRYLHTLRKIEISKELITHHTWDYVLFILKHEIAHQMVYEKYPEEEPHGKRFQEACSRIGLPAYFRRASIDLKEEALSFDVIKEFQGSNSLQRKIEKLNALASSSSNPHEATLALQMARKIAFEHNLSLEKKDDEKKNFYHFTVFPKKKKLSRIYVLLSSILQSHYFVNVIFSESYDPLDNTFYKTLEIVGHMHNVVMAEYVYEFLMRNLKDLSKSYKKEKQDGHKKSFEEGLLLGFREKLDEEKKRNMADKPSSYALMLTQDQVDFYSSSVFPKTRHTSSRSTRQVSPSDLEAGKQKGYHLNLHKPMSQSPTSPLLLGSSS